jgi:FKBP-type peptidyl-prolyl cis-trans isomerase 2
MKQGDFVEIDFTGRIAATGEIFDLTSEDTARKEGIYDPKQKYGPALVVIGARMALPGVEKELLTMKVGEEREFTLTPDRGFGFRNPQLVRVVSIASFAKQKINPVPGMFVTIDNRQARIQSVSGGRVRVDFNNPLAGKELSYRMRIVREIKQAREKVRSLLDYYALPLEPSLEGDRLTLSSEKPVPEPLQKMLEGNITRWVRGVKSVKFVSRERKPGAAKQPAEGKSAPEKPSTKARSPGGV